MLAAGLNQTWFWHQVAVVSCFFHRHYRRISAR